MAACIWAPTTAPCIVSGFAISPAKAGHYGISPAEAEPYDSPSPRRIERWSRSVSGDGLFPQMSPALRKRAKRLRAIAHARVQPHDVLIGGFTTRLHLDDLVRVLNGDRQFPEGIDQLIF
jgi:hypothetical protein